MGGIEDVSTLSDFLLTNRDFGNTNKVRSNLQKFNLNLSLSFRALPLTLGVIIASWLSISAPGPCGGLGTGWLWPGRWAGYSWSSPACTPRPGSVGWTKTFRNVCTIYYFRTMCRLSVESLRHEILEKSLESGGQDSQYVNTPSCQDEDWGRRYFGDNYGKLLAIKKLWDPKNIFNYCQSVGSNSSSCCL